MTTPAPAGQSGYETTTYTYDGDGNLIETTAPPAASGGPNQVTVDTYNAAGQLASQTTGYGTAAAVDHQLLLRPGRRYRPPSSRPTATPPASPRARPPRRGRSSARVTRPRPRTRPPTATTPPGSWSPPPPRPPRRAGRGHHHLHLRPGREPAHQHRPRRRHHHRGPTHRRKPDSRRSATPGPPAHSVTYTYDADGNMTGMTDGTGSSSYSYDPFGELTSATNGAGQTVGYAYDADGDTTGITYPLPATATWATSDTVGYGYDHADQLTSSPTSTATRSASPTTADGLPASVTLGPPATPHHHLRPHRRAVRIALANSSDDAAVASATPTPRRQTS